MCTEFWNWAYAVNIQTKQRQNLPVQKQISSPCLLVCFHTSHQVADWKACAQHDNKNLHSYSLQRPLCRSGMAMDTRSLVWYMYTECTDWFQLKEFQLVSGEMKQGNLWCLPVHCRRFMWHGFYFSFPLSLSCGACLCVWPVWVSCTVEAIIFKAWFCNFLIFLSFKPELVHLQDCQMKGVHLQLCK